jgi:hypothetical protein
MKQLLTTMALILLSINITNANDKTGVYNIEINLKNNETVIIDTTINNILNKTTLSIEDGYLNTAIINSFDEENINSNLLIEYANSVLKNRNIGYSGVVPNKYSGLGYIGQRGVKISNRISNVGYNIYKKSGDTNKFKQYYHKLFRNSFSRKILVNKSTSFLVSTCKLFPKDFQENLICELTELLDFSYKLDSFHEINTDRLRSYWEGFIYRRNKIDNVPITEIQGTIRDLINTISAIEVNEMNYSLISIKINEDLTLHYKSGIVELSSLSSKNTIKFNKKVNIQSVKYMKDETGTFYLFEGEKNGISCKYLFSKELIEIMNTEDVANSIYFTSSGREKLLAQPDLKSTVSYSCIEGDEIAIIDESKENPFFFKVKTKNNKFGYLQKNIFSEEVIFLYSSDDYNRKFHQYLIDNNIKRR